MSKRKKTKKSPLATTPEQIRTEPAIIVETVGDEQLSTTVAELTEAGPVSPELMAEAPVLGHEVTGEPAITTEPHQLEPTSDLVLELEHLTREEPDVTAASALTLPPAAPKRLSALDAAAQVLAETKQPMNCQELIGAMAIKGLWSTPNGKTPAATLYSAIIREIATRGRDARFKKTGRGTFAAN